ncbi:MAG: glycoside hydrolase family 15 protein [Actinobacteria bacterium]|nr:glycoside hydrolase family 15 protein [Actinomycetota bacterium]MBO0786152.1 glycoside hydrolase family 15 protein [Actinomycetota bacterium]MBO0814730.1 glycoside hydrolase family 15 protein [Actinomycetota bacterium]
MDRYPDISDHGLIGDLQTAALVTTDGTIDFFCCPRFDSPSVFASLLDADRGGHFRIAPATGDYVSRQLYFPETAMLITRFMTADGVGEVLDFMPVIEGGPTGRHRLVRHLRVARGTMQFVMDLQPRFDYGRAKHTAEVTEHGAVFRSDGMELTLHTSGARSGSEGGPAVERVGDGLRATFTMSEGEYGRGVVLESMGGEPQALAPAELERLASGTGAYWRRWLGRMSYTGRWREMVARSAMTLKLLTYQPSGAIVAAATTGLPEQAGGERNWDYRFTWVRDGSLSVHALLGLGYTEEAAAFARWLRDRFAEHADGGRQHPLKIMFRVDGSSDLTEQTLDHFEGWRGSAPVRIGNGAADQLQLDIFGEAMDAVYDGVQYGLPVAHQGWEALATVIDWVGDNWDQPDEGIWETRGGRKDFTYGRFQCWVALDRAIRLAQRLGWPANAAKWAAERDRLYEQIMTRGWKPGIGAFTQHYDTDVLDSALLLMPIEGFISARDPMWLSTLAAMDKELVSDSLVYRYNPEASPDGLRGTEGTFSLCTFLYVDALARAGRLDDAVLTFEKMHTYGNHLGLYSEEIGPTGEQLGNFPQAFTHLSLINAAITLNRQLDQEAGLGKAVLAGR